VTHHEKGLFVVLHSVSFFFKEKKERCFKKQHICIKFCLKLGKTATKTCDMTRFDFGKETVSKTHNIPMVFEVQKWNYFC
jgi:hypothetical protein